MAAKLEPSDSLKWAFQRSPCVRSSAEISLREFVAVPLVT
jgi:hypothetical protein